MENQMQDEISLLDLWHRIWKNKYLVIAITLLITILGTFILFFLNRSSATLNNKFVYNFVNMQTETYVDGSLFNYRDLTSKSFIASIIEKDERFKDLDAEKLSDDENGIKVSYIVNKANNSDVILDSYLELDLPLPLFKNNKDLAKVFANAIHESIVQNGIAKNNTFLLHSSFKTYKNEQLTTTYDELTYFEILDNFRSQYNMIYNAYRNIINSYGAITLDGISVEKILNDFRSWYTQRVLVDSLEAELNENNFIKNYNETAKYAKLKISSIDKTINLNTSIIDALTLKFDDLMADKQNIEASIIFDEITERIIENETLKVDKARYQEIIDHGTENINAAFDSELSSIAATFEEYIDQYNELYIDYLNENTRYIPYNNSEYDVNKQFNMILMVIVMGMLGGILGASTALIKEAAHSKKEEQPIV
ncbi:MAG: hypothetical protein GX312_01900 [Candidatus Phytoplasma sp.]|nr:hypothetical protein [Phytoplasma sp.]